MFWQNCRNIDGYRAENALNYHQNVIRAGTADVREFVHKNQSEYKKDYRHDKTDQNEKIYHFDAYMMFWMFFLRFYIMVLCFLLFHDFKLSLLDFISPLYFTPKKHCHKTMPFLWYKIISYLILIHQPVFCKFMWKIMHFLISWGRSKLSKYYVPNCETRWPFFASKYHFCRFICTNYIF